VRGLEKLWGLAIRDVDAIEDGLLVALGAGNEGNGTSSLNLWNDESNSENLVEIWRKSQISRELERLLSAQEPTISDGKRKRTEPDVQVSKRIGTIDSLVSGFKRGGEDNVGRQVDEFQRLPELPSEVSFSGLISMS